MRQTLRRVTLFLVLVAAVDLAANESTDAEDESLRTALIAAVEAGDTPRLASLIRDHHDAIVQNFGAWIAQQAALDGAARTASERALEAVAAHFETQGDRTLRGLLSGIAAGNRARGWARTLSDAAAMARSGRCADAMPVLERVAEEMRGWRGAAVEVVAMGVGDVLGACFLEAGDHARALSTTYAAYERAVAHADRGATVRFGRRMAETYLAAGDEARARDWAGGTAGVLRADGRAAEADALLETFGVGRSE